MVHVPNPTDITSSLDTRDGTDASLIENITPHLDWTRPEPEEIVVEDEVAVEDEEVETEEEAAAREAADAEAAAEAVAKAEAEAAAQDEADAAAEAQLAADADLAVAGGGEEALVIESTEGDEEDDEEEAERPEMQPLPDDLADCTREELDEFAAQRGIATPKTMNKPEVIDALLAWETDPEGDQD